MAIHRCANAYYFSAILEIGGIESHLYYLAQKYGKYDITVFYRTGNQRQLKRLRQFVRCVQLKPEEKVICTNVFCCFNREILDQCEADHVYLVLHGDYLDMVNRKQLNRDVLPLDDRVDTYLGVSKLVCESWETLTGIKAEFVGEPIVLPNRAKPLLLISATRLSPEKGWDRMQILADALDSADVNYLWHIYTNSPKPNSRPNLTFLPTRLDIVEKLKAYDAFVQLSDNEGFCLSVVEALASGVPVIGTDLPVFKEIGLNEENSIILPMDMSDIPVDKIANISRDLKGFSYTPPKENWNKYLKHTKSTYVVRSALIRATGEWRKNSITSVDLGYIPREGETWYVDSDRLAIIEDFEKRTGAHMVDVIEREVSK